ncbi:MAG: tripartite tricarboxylate transporter TctB family protein [Pseudomonadota bacterium]
MSNSVRPTSLARFVGPLIIVALAVVAIVVAEGFEQMPPILKRGVQPSDFPQIVAALIIGLALFSIWREPVRRDQDTNRTAWRTAALLLLFIALTTIDFLLALGVFAAAMAALWGERRIGALLVIGIVVPIVIFLFFDQVFDIRFPRGVLTDLWYG